MSGFTHFDAEGRAVMVDVGDKPVTARTATAAGAIHLQSTTLERIRAGGIAKGDVLIIPAGVPHWFKEVTNPFLYYVVKAR